jgi:hypothetical protein
VDGEKQADVGLTKILRAIGKQRLDMPPDTLTGCRENFIYLIQDTGNKTRFFKMKQEEHKFGPP